MATTKKKSAPATALKVVKFVSPAMAEMPAYKFKRDYVRIGGSLTGMQYDEVEVVVELDELRDIVTSSWFIALSRRRRDPDVPLKLTIVTEIP